jgi:hypothetical protein
MQVPKHEVHLDSSLVILQSQKALPHNWVTLKDKKHPFLTAVNSKTKNIQLLNLNAHITDTILLSHCSKNE